MQQKLQPSMQSSWPEESSRLSSKPPLNQRGDSHENRIAPNLSGRAKTTNLGKVSEDLHRIRVDVAVVVTDNDVVMVGKASQSAPSTLTSVLTVERSTEKASDLTGHWLSQLPIRKRSNRQFRLPSSDHRKWSYTTSFQARSWCLHWGLRHQALLSTTTLWTKTSTTSATGNHLR